MSEFCGKCDLWDSLVNIGRVTDDYDWDRVKIYHKDELLDIRSVKDLLPYAGYLTTVACYHKGDYNIHISNESFVDREERESLERSLKWIENEYRRLKRRKEKFIPEEVAKRYSWINAPYVLEICKRVAEHPYSANINGIHTNMHQYYRERLRDEMIDYGYTKEQADKWVYEGLKTW